MSKIIRVFPRRTKATPTDEQALTRSPELWDAADEVHVSVTFEWDKPKAERLAKEWEVVAPVKIGGPAYDDPGLTFTPGMYLKQGYVITSRGCPNHCPNCKVPKREGKLRLLPICDGYDILDNNILATPKEHVEAVFKMLLRQKEYPKFTGGLEAKRLEGWHIDWLLRLKPETMWTAYDRPDEWEPLVRAVSMLSEAGIVAPHKRKRVGVYVLMGWRGDTIAEAEKRLRSVIGLGVKTQAMWLDNGMASKPEDFKAWGDLRKHFTDAREVGAMVQATWGDK